MVVENLHRNDQHPFELAASLAEANTKYTLEELAVRFNMDIATIHRRIKLTQLSPGWKKLIADPKKNFKEWPFGHLEYIAHFPADQQDDIAEDFDHWDFEDSVPTLGTLKRQLANRLRVLDGVPWDLDDAALCPRAGSCTACQFRSDRELSLFNDEDMGLKGKKAKPAARCLNEKCFEEKREAFIGRQRSEAAARLGRPVDEVAVLRGGGQQLGGDVPQIFPHEMKKVKEGSKGAVPVIDLGDGGKLAWVKLKEDSVGSGAGTAKKTPAKPVQEMTAKEAEAKLRERMEAMEKRRRVLTWQKICGAVEGLAGKTPSPKIDVETRLRLQCAYPGHMCRVLDDYHLAPRDKRAMKLNTDELSWWLFGRGVRGFCESHKYSWEPLEAADRELLKALKVDVAAIEKSVMEELPDPKSWGALRAAAGKGEKKEKGAVQGKAKAKAKASPKKKAVAKKKSAKAPAAVMADDEEFIDYED